MLRFFCPRLLLLLTCMVISLPRSEARFEILEPQQTGLNLENEYDDPKMWSSRFREFTLGAVSVGIASGDLNGDGRPDIYAVSKTGPNGLYFQTEQPLVFREAAEQAGVAGTEHWETGVTFVDIDNDEDLDIYLCVYDGPNQLYINDGSGHFTEQAAAYGLALHDASVMAAFADYDCDGDLDVYIQTNVLEFARNTKGSPDYLYRNNGDGTFTDVSKASGIWGRSQGHSATWWDHDGDGWPDLYVANDFETPDRFYHNNGDGTFSDRIEDLVPLTTFFSMGSDAGDLNNDGLMDFMVADMEAADHYKDMTGMEERSRGIWDTESVLELTPQYARNAIYLNTGLDRFQEVAYLFEVPGTNWTWSVKLRDLDNDGWLDLYITNGMVRNLIDADLVDRQNTARTLAHRAAVVKNSPPLQERNFAFRNTGELGFEDVSAAWNLDQESVAFGSTVCDFDRDGDLDIAYVGMDQAVLLARNDLQPGANYLTLRLQGKVSNSWGLGAAVKLFAEDGQQLRQLHLARGIVSSDEPLVHFGLGANAEVQSLEVHWPSGTVDILENLRANQLLTVVEGQHAVAEPESGGASETVAAPLFTRRVDLEGTWPTHTLVDSGEFNRAPLLPRRVGQAGPALAKGDLNGDGAPDFFVGGGRGQPASLMLSDNGKASLKRVSFEQDPQRSDSAAAIFDANGDGWQDLLVLGTATGPAAESVASGLYLNVGDGSFGSVEAASGIYSGLSGACLAVADFDGDGDTDVFVGGGTVPESYPFSEPNMLYRNDGGSFAEISERVAPGLSEVGLVLDAQWVDYDGDGDADLVLVSEWGTLSLFENDGSRFSNVSKDRGLDRLTGLWRSLATADLNGDGLVDFSVGNLGLNTKYRAKPGEPATLFAGNAEGDGANHLLEAYYESGRLLPLRGRSKLNYAFPWVSEAFGSFDAFAKADLYDIFGEERLGRMERFEADELRSGAWISNERGSYDFVPFERAAQFGPTMDILVGDWNADGEIDLVLAQNFYGQEASTGRLGGSVGCVLVGNGDGTFSALPPAESGLLLSGDQRSMSVQDLDGDGRLELIATQNDGPVTIYSLAR